MAKKTTRERKEKRSFIVGFEEQLLNVAKDKTIEDEAERAELLVSLANKIREFETEIEALEEREKERGNERPA